MDIGYRNFKLRKLSGRVSYHDIPEFDPWMDRQYAVSEETINAIMNRLKDDAYTEEQDFELYLDLERLYASKTPGIARYLRRYVSSQWEAQDALPFAARLLGKYGNADDIPLIQRMMNKTDNFVIRQNLSDAIEALRGA